MSGQLDNAVVLVTGATGEVGWGVAHAATDAGAHVVLPTRSEGSAATLRDEFPDGTVVVADVSTVDGIATLSDVIAGIGRLDHVVAPLGAWWQKGPSLAQPSEELAQLLSTYVTAQHRLVAATAADLRASTGSYTLVTGAAGEGMIPDAGLLVVAVRAQYALADVLRTELRDEPFRFNEFRIDTRIERMRRPGVVESRVAGRAFVETMASDTRSSTIRFPG